jgi:hypothetical protein
LILPTKAKKHLPAELVWLKSQGIKSYDPFAKSPEVTDQGVKPE